MVPFCANFLSGNEFENALTIFYCFDYGKNKSDAVEKIAIDEHDYHKCSLCVIVNFITRSYHQQH